MDRLKEIAGKRKRAHVRLAVTRSRIYNAFLDMEEAAFSSKEHLMNQPGY